MKSTSNSIDHGIANPKFSLVIPCYNEALTLPSLIERASYVATSGNGEVILVDNGSTDNSQQVLTSLLPKHPGVRSYLVEVNRGYGYGILAGLEVARADLVGWTHADMQSDPIDVLRAVKLASSRPIFIKGRRYGRGLIDRFFSGGMSIVVSLMFGKVLREVNAQPTLFDRELMDDWGIPPNDFSLDVFALVAAKRSKRPIKRIPVLFPPREFGESSWNTGLRARLRLAQRTFSYCVQLRFRPDQPTSGGAK